MGSLLTQLQSCCQNESERSFSFSLTAEATDALHRRSKEMETKRLLLDAFSSQSEFIAVSTIYVLSFPAERIYVQAKDRTQETLAITAQMGINYARMEFEGVPRHGWEVNVERRTCGYRYYWKFSVCVHVLFAMRQRSYVDHPGNQMLVNRSTSNKRRRTKKQGSGRPALNGPRYV
ncbi:hypothetical protein PPTG_05567 [Phytophthora nicotianae INRA-310]|uniref:SWIM-type domain-containing protein n=1 Tax=Phytophthora nicotianae (strain INRA-310) TaxID=761204 RepID=W2QZM2_PHYN3|nr:hypothetical protein PPTG_05567 [Phytophthora nicotianae INRA-310]ETN17894.1 hypothetical protein PPTG_05567 [Phytophthora nicotianae INRA-310]